jgi:hypothetical protein
VYCDILSVIGSELLRIEAAVKGRCRTWDLESVKL